MRRTIGIIVAPISVSLLLLGCTSADNPERTNAGSAEPASTTSAPPTTSPGAEESSSTRAEATSSPAPSGASEEQGYTRAEIDYFEAIALGSEFEGSPETVKKWLQDVDVQVSGQPTAADLETLDDTVTDLNELISPIDINIVDQDADINIYIVPLSEFREYIPTYVEGNWGYFSYRFRETGELYTADIVVRSEGIEQGLRSHLLREELTQSFGLAKDSNTYPDSIFYQGTSFVEEYSDLDETMIDILYRPEIETGFTKQQVEEALVSD